MVSKGLILGMVAGLGVILYAVTMSGNNMEADIPEFDDQKKSELQDAVDMCTNDVGNMQSGGSLEQCLDDAYETFGTEEEKQTWFDDEH